MIRLFLVNPPYCSYLKRSMQHILQIAHLSLFHTHILYRQRMMKWFSAVTDGSSRLIVQVFLVLLTRSQNIHSYISFNCAVSLQPWRTWDNLNLRLHSRGLDTWSWCPRSWRNWFNICEQIKCHRRSFYKWNTINSTLLLIVSSNRFNFHFLLTACPMARWSNWTRCTKPCGAGIQERVLILPKKAKGSEYSHCKNLKETRACNVHPC